MVQCGGGVEEMQHVEKKMLQREGHSAGLTVGQWMTMMGRPRYARCNLLS
jgi:hypothetical protein